MLENKKELNKQHLVMAEREREREKWVQNDKCIGEEGGGRSVTFQKEANITRRHYRVFIDLKQKKKFDFCQNCF